MGICWSDPPQPARQEPVIQSTQQSYTVSNPQFAYPAPQVYMTNQAVQLYVKTLTGKVIPITAYLSETVYQVKQRIHFLSGILPEQQVLIYMGKELDANKYLFFYQFYSGITIHLVIRMT